MGGAERAERKRRQEAAARAASTRTARPRQRIDPKRFALWIGATVLVAAVVIGYLMYRDAVKNATEGKDVVVKQTSAQAEVRDGVGAVIGDADATATLDIYADFLCPACGVFEERWGSELLERANAGALRLRVHLVPMLTELSDPPGYSLEAANAAVCAADHGKFTPFHDSLFADQPDEGARGWDEQQLIKLGRDVGITAPGFADCVRGGTYDQQLTAEFDRTVQRMPDFSTPTVIGPSGPIDWNSDDWLDAVAPPK